MLIELLTSAGASGVIVAVFWGIGHVSKEGREWVRLMDERKWKRRKRRKR